MKRVVLYSMSSCPHCDSAKRYLEKQKIKFRLVDVKTPSGQKEFARSGYRAVPVLKIGEDFMNGFSVNQFNKHYSE